MKPILGGIILKQRIVESFIDGSGRQKPPIKWSDEMLGNGSDTAA